MNVRLFAAASIAALISTPAYAFHCPTDMKAIDEALAQNPPLMEEQLTEVKELRIASENLHNKGKHGASIEALHRALEILGIAHK